MSAGQAGEEGGEEMRGGGGIEAGGGLVEEEERGVAGEGEGGEQAGALATGEVAGIGTERRVEQGSVER